MSEDSRGAVDEAINDPVRKASQYCKKAQSRAKPNHFLVVLRERSSANADTSALKYRKKPAKQ